MKPIRIFRHIACEGPGYFGVFLEKHNIPFDLVRIDAGKTPPDAIDDVSGLVFMGGPMSVNDDLPWIPQELALIRQATARGLPVLGHCLGGQLISKALGGEVTANPVREIGWLPVQKIPGPQADDWLAGFSDGTELFHWHGERFSIPDGASAILRSEHCAQQGFVRDNILALQCHVEMTGEMVREWSTRYRDELDEPTPTVQSRDAITRNLDERVKRLQAVADALYLRWLRPLIAARR